MMKVLRTGRHGFTLVENVITTAIVLLLTVGLVGMMIMATRLVKAAAHSVQAAEIAEAKLESVRTCGWPNIVSGTFIPTNFSVTNGVVYSGAITLGKTLTAETYNSDVIEARVRVSWMIDNRPRSFELVSFVSKYGTSATP